MKMFIILFYCHPIFDFPFCKVMPFPLITGSLRPISGSHRADTWEHGVNTSSVFSQETPIPPRMRSDPSSLGVSEQSNFD